MEATAICQCLLQTAQGHKEDREAPRPCGPALIGPPSSQISRSTARGAHKRLGHN